MGTIFDHRPGSLLHDSPRQAMHIPFHLQDRDLHRPHRGHFVHQTTPLDLQLNQGDGLLQDGNHREAMGQGRRQVHGDLSGTDDRDEDGLPCRLQPGISHAVDEHRIHPPFLCSSHLEQNIRDGQGFIVGGFDGSGAFVQRYGTKLGARSGEASISLHDGAYPLLPHDGDDDAESDRAPAFAPRALRRSRLAFLITQDLFLRRIGVGALAVHQACVDQGFSPLQSSEGGVYDWDLATALGQALLHASGQTYHARAAEDDSVRTVLQDRLGRLICQGFEQPVSVLVQLQNGDVYWSSRDELILEAVKVGQSLDERSVALQDGHHREAMS